MSVCVCVCACARLQGITVIESFMYTFVLLRLLDLCVRAGKLEGFTGGVCVTLYNQRVFVIE